MGQAPVTTCANNHGWHDDVSVGSIIATVTLKACNTSLQALGAWVITFAPRFALSIDRAIMLDGVLLQVAVDKLGPKLPVNKAINDPVQRSKMSVFISPTRREGMLWPLA